MSEFSEASKCKKILFVLNDFRFGGVTKVNTVIANKLSENHQVTIYNSGAGKCSFPVKVPVYKEKYRWEKFSYYYPRVMKKFCQLTGFPVNPKVFERERIQKLCQYIQKEKIELVVLNAFQIIYVNLPQLYRRDGKLQWPAPERRKIRRLSIIFKKNIIPTENWNIRGL